MTPDPQSAPRAWVMPTIPLDVTAVRDRNGDLWRRLNGRWEMVNLETGALNMIPADGVDLQEFFGPLTIETAPAVSEFAAGNGEGGAMKAELVIGEAIVVGPQDRLVVAFPQDTSRLQLDQLSHLLREAFGDRAIAIVGMEQIAVVQNDREGICGDESPHHSVNCSGTLPALCHLRFGHGSSWHESETGQRWKYANSALPNDPPVDRGGESAEPPG